MREYARKLIDRVRRGRMFLYVVGGPWKPIHADGNALLCVVDLKLYKLEVYQHEVYQRELVFDCLNY